MRRFFAPFLVLLLLQGCSDDSTPSFPPPVTFTTSFSYTVALNATQQVPHNDSMATASALIEVDTTLNRMRASMDLSGVSEVQAAHIHIGTLGMNGDVAYAFVAGANDVYTVPERAVSEAVIMQIQNGELYINVHTTAYPGGEIRGQIVPDTVAVLGFELGGNQQVPMVMTDAMGFAYASYDSASGELQLVARTSGVDDATMAHIHTGRVGMNGPVLVALEQSMDDMSVWMTPTNTTIDSAIFAVLASGGHYVNVHTPAHPSGELRGQITTSNMVLVTFGLDGQQEVPAVMSDGMGDGYALVNTDTYDLELRVVTSGLDDVSMAHIHTGRIGMNGPVLVALEQSMDDMNLWSTPDNTMIDADIFAVLAGGGHYVNVHTATVPSGEIRGQILTNNYALVTFALDGEQEVPAVATMGMGDGYALVNTNNYALELVIVTDGVDDATMAHIHTGRIGMNGPVLVALEQSMDDMGMWMTPAGTAIDADILATLLSGGHYVNVHTPSVASGEIRGQILTDNFVFLTFPLEGNQQVPAVVTEASGSGYAMVNTNDYAVELVAVTTGVDDASMAHIHTGVRGENGPVFVALEQSAEDSGVWMTPDGAMLTPEIFAVLASGGHYVNIHTPDHPSGELRGQIE